MVMSGYILHRVYALRITLLPFSSQPLIASCVLLGPSPESSPFFPHYIDTAVHSHLSSQLTALHVKMVHFAPRICPAYHIIDLFFSTTHRIMCVTWSFPRILPVFSSLYYSHCSSQSFVVTTGSITCENGSFHAALGGGAAPLF